MMVCSPADILYRVETNRQTNSWVGRGNPYRWQTVSVKPGFPWDLPGWAHLVHQGRVIQIVEEVELSERKEKRNDGGWTWRSSRKRDPWDDRSDVGMTEEGRQGDCAVSMIEWEERKSNVDISWSRHLVQWSWRILMSNKWHHHGSGIRPQRTAHMLFCRGWKEAGRVGSIHEKGWW